MTYAEVARELGIDADTLSKWVAQARPGEGEDGRGSAAPSRRTAGRRGLREGRSPDLARRHLDTDGPDQAWFADTAYVRTCRGRPCLAVVTGILSMLDLN